MSHLKWKYNTLVLCDHKEHGYFLGRVQETSLYNIVVKPERYFVKSTELEQVEMDISRVKLVEDGEKVMKEASSYGYNTSELLMDRGLVTGEAEKYKAMQVATQVYVDKHYRRVALGKWADRV